jgi:hypothetical protein
VVRSACMAPTVPCFPIRVKSPVAVVTGVAALGRAGRAPPGGG